MSESRNVTTEGRDEIWGELGKPEIRDRLMKVARSISGSAPDAEDAVQDALVQAMVNAHRFRADARVSTWVHRIAVNAALMAKRRSGTQGKRLNQIQSAELEVCDPSPSVEQILIERQSQSQLRAALVRLPERTRRTIEQTLSLQNERGTTVGTNVAPDRATAADVTPNAIRARLSRARSRLRQIIESMDPALPGMA